VSSMRRFWPSLLVAAALGTGCGGGKDGDGGSTAPTGGLLTVTLATPNADDGAVLLTVTGGGVEAVESAVAGYQVFSSPTASGTTHLIVTGDIVAGPLVRLRVPDVGVAASYAATVTQAAARATFAQQATDGYTLTVGKQ
jgi:hypothetical protein